MKNNPSRHKKPIQPSPIDVGGDWLAIYVRPHTADAGDQSFSEIQK
jgi:hypothetical protein